MSRTPSAPHDSSQLARSVYMREGIGVSAQVLQGQRLEILRIRVEWPALILVDRGIKAVEAERNMSITARQGQGIALVGNQTVDFTNSVLDGRQYEARWLLFDSSLLDDPYYDNRAKKLDSPGLRRPSAQLIAAVPHGLRVAFDGARDALAHSATMPESVARQRMLEVMHWLLEVGVVLRTSPQQPTVSVRVRTLLTGRLDREWTAERTAAELAMSAATLRRRLAAEHATFADLLVDARMSMALTLLQATSQPISEIALSVGYQSPSRFAIRFRQRFGFAPSAVRSHEHSKTRPMKEPSAVAGT